MGTTSYRTATASLAFSHESGFCLNNTDCQKRFLEKVGGEVPSKAVNQRVVVSWAGQASCITKTLNQLLSILTGQRFVGQILCSIVVAFAQHLVRIPVPGRQCMPSSSPCCCSPSDTISGKNAALVSKIS